MGLDVHSEHHQKPSCERVLDRRAAADEMAESVGPVVVFVVNIVLAVEIVAAVNEKAEVAGHLRQILVADEPKHTVIHALQN
jgi:hypothetical protein